jgi:hypothetical protein
MRTIDTEHNWFWKQGYLDGLFAIAPDEARHLSQRSDYFAGYDAGSGDRKDAQELQERLSAIAVNAIERPL